jgi:hypothetical protein
MCGSLDIVFFYLYAIFSYPPLASDSRHRASVAMGFCSLLFGKVERAKLSLSRLSTESASRE